MDNKNILKPTDDDVDYRKLQNYQNTSLLTRNKLSSRDPYDGQLDKNSEVRLRLAIIDNYELKRDQDVAFNPLDIKNCFVCFSWSTFFYSRNVIMIYFLPVRVVVKSCHK